MEKAKKNLVFHFGVGRQPSSLKIGYVNMAQSHVDIKPIIDFLKRKEKEIQNSN